MPSIFDLLDQTQQTETHDNISPETAAKSQQRSIFDILEEPVADMDEQSPKEKIGEDLPMQSISGIQEGAKPQDQKFQSESDFEKEEARGSAHTFSRIFETIAGLPGDVQKFLKGVLGPFSGIGIELPGSQQIKEGIGKLTGGYTLPKNEFEEKVGEFVSDVASFAIPGSKTYSLARNIGIPFAGSFVKETLKDQGADEKNSSYAKIGTMIALDLMQARKGGAKKFSSDLFNESEKLVPKGQTVDSKNIESSLKSLRKELSLGGEKAPSTSNAISQIDDILSQVKDGKIEVNELIARRKKLNEVIFDPTTPSKIRKKALSNLDKVKEKVIDGIDEYGKINPEFGELNKAANESWAAYSKSNFISNFIDKNFHKALRSNGAKLLFGLGGVGAAAKLAPAALGAIPLYSGVKLAVRVSKSPTLRKYYQGVITSAASGNISQMSNNLNILDEKLENEEKKEKQRERDLLKN